MVTVTNILIHVLLSPIRVLSSFGIDQDICLDYKSCSLGPKSHSLAVFLTVRFAFSVENNVNGHMLGFHPQKQKVENSVTEGFILGANGSIETKYNQCNQK